MNTITAKTSPAFEPAHPGIMIRDMLNEARVSSRTAAASLGVTPPALGNVLLGRSGITPDMALRLARYFGNSAQFWTRLQEGYDLWHRSVVLQSDLAKIERMAFEVRA
ncbi:MAG: HigA family addiction module antitoxin [Janthinobacterium lividum]